MSLLLLFMNNHSKKKPKISFLYSTTLNETEYKEIIKSHFNLLDNFIKRQSFNKVDGSYFFHGKASCLAIPLLGILNLLIPITLKKDLGLSCL